MSVSKPDTIETNKENTNYSMPSTLSDEISLIPITTPTIDPYYKNAREEVLLDKSTVSKGDSLVIMGQIWNPMNEGSAPSFDGIKNVSITLFKNGQTIKTTVIPLNFSGYSLYVTKYFTRLINTSDLEPGNYSILIQFNSGHSSILTFKVTNQEQKCGSTICSYPDKCCDNTCYNPMVNVCINGSITSPQCDTSQSGVQIDNKTKCYENLVCPEGKYKENGYFSGCAEGVQCPDIKIGTITHSYCYNLVKCGPNWCPEGTICCGGRCIPKNNGDYRYFCGYQWTSSDLMSPPELF